MAHYIRLPQVDSTNTHLLRHASRLPSGAVVYTPHQRAGRGQKGNRWLAQPGMNATFSYLFRPNNLPALKQFCVSEAASLAVARTLSRMTGRVLSVKWPNDIYVGDRKICGILIENSLDGSRVAHSVIGIGINVNQREFDPYAPNPTSMALVAARDFEPDEVMRAVCESLELLLSRIDTDCGALHDDYLSALYRADGEPHTFVLPDGTAFEATIVDVASDGMLALRLCDGIVQRYAFKQVAFVVG